jgi:preprotein translocase subunit SecY
VVGRRVYGGQTTHLPLRVNTSGVIPVIFASSIIAFPQTIASFLKADNAWMRNLFEHLQWGMPLYNLLYVSFIIFFCYFYTAIVFNPDDVAENMRKHGGFVPGIRPGDQTARYIDKILVRLTLAGAVYITFVCLLPEFLILKYNVPFYFGGTSLLIIVVVTMDFMAQVQNYLMSQQYESLLKKANFKTTLSG